MTGYIKIHRVIDAHPLFHRRPEYLGAFVKLLMRAAYQDHDVRVGQKMVRLARGEQIVSARRFAEELGWSHKKMRNFLDLMRTQGVLEMGTQEGTVGTRVIICNYSTYQGSHASEGHSQGHVEGTVGAQLGHTTKEGKEGKEEDSPNGLVVVPTPDVDLLGDEPAPKPARSKPQPIAEAFEAYNRTAERCGLPQAILTPARRKSIGARLREHGLDGWNRMLANVERSAFLCGKTTNWRADLGFLVKPEKFTKVLEGGYGNGRHAKPAADDGPSVEDLYRFDDEVEHAH